MAVVTRGDVWLADFDPTVGSEIRKTRPCVVVSADDMNAAVRTLIVAPMTTGARRTSFRLAIQFQGKNGLVLPDQIRTIDRSRLRRRLGALPSDALVELLALLRATFAD